MADEQVLEHVVDVARRHGGTENVEGPIPPPKIGGNFALDDSVIDGKQTPSSPQDSGHRLTIDASVA